MTEVIKVLTNLRGEELYDVVRWLEETKMSYNFTAGKVEKTELVGTLPTSRLGFVGRVFPSEIEISGEQNILLFELKFAELLDGRNMWFDAREKNDD